MDLTEIFNTLLDPNVYGPCVNIIIAIITAIFLRKNTRAKEFEKLKIGLLGEAFKDMIDSGVMTYSEFYKTKNILRIAKKADEYYSQNPHFHIKEHLDFDWFFRLYNDAGYVSDDYLKKIWAKLLCNEVGRETSYSYKTIDVLKNMNKEDAQLFEEICCHSFRADSTVFLPSYDDYLLMTKIQHDDLIKLSEYGLIHIDRSIELTVDTSYHDEMLFNSQVAIVFPKGDIKLNIPQFKFTSVGNDIAHIVNKYCTNTELIWLANKIKNQREIDLRIFYLQKNKDGSLQYDGKREMHV